MSGAEIRRLSSEVIERIAAGEVVQRPESAIKELVENAMDAEASAITVEIRDGGIASIRVTDIGTGIAASQVRMAFERHATSKLRKSEELTDIRTLGFRGEALAAISAVSRVTLTSRARGADEGVTVSCEGGVIGEIKPAASPFGTTLVVRDLFFNAPVRLKFLKKPAMEAAAVSELMARLILSHPEISFRFLSQGKTMFHSVGDGRLSSALFSVYGKDVLSGLIPVDGARAGVLVSGFVGVGDLARGNRAQESFFVNGRSFRDEALSRAVEAGCRSRVTIGRYPMCALALTLPFQQVDVNVHPNKLEVRFQRPEDVARAVMELTAEALARAGVAEVLGAAVAPDSVPEIGAAGGATAVAGDGFEAYRWGKDAGGDAVAGAERAEPSSEKVENPLDVPLNSRVVVANPNASSDVLNGFVENRAPANVMRETPFMPRFPAGSGAFPPDSAATRFFPTKPEKPAMPAVTRTGSASPATSSPTVSAASETIEQTTFAAAEPPAGADAARYIGSAFNTYLIFEQGDQLFLIDQHAAHERLLFDRFSAACARGEQRQMLLTPVLVRLTFREMALAREQAQALSDTGFDFAPFDDTSVTVYAVPMVLGEAVDAKTVLLEALDSLSSLRGSATEERRRAALIQMACKHAIKGGDPLSERDARALLRQLLETDTAPTCPHGRPIVIPVSKRDLERRFKRLQ